MKTKTFNVKIDFQGVSDITNGDVQRMFDYFLEYNIRANDYGILNIDVDTISIEKIHDL